MMRRLLALSVVVLGLSGMTPVLAQGYFVPPPPKPPAAPPPPPAAPHPPAAPSSQAMPMPAPMMQGADADAPPIQVPMPPEPVLPDLPKGTPSPVAVIGVISVPDVMRASSAAQQIDRIIGERRQRLNDDAQREQAAWREIQQSISNDRAKLSPEQLRTRERDLQDRITKTQKVFRDRNRIIQEATQFGVNQIQSSLTAVIKQVAKSRGMNMVLHQGSVALNTNEFDITLQVLEQLKCKKLQKQSTKDLLKMN